MIWSRELCRSLERGGARPNVNWPAGASTVETPAGQFEVSLQRHEVEGLGAPQVRSINCAEQFAIRSPALRVPRGTRLPRFRRS